MIVFQLLQNSYFSQSCLSNLCKNKKVEISEIEASKKACRLAEIGCWITYIFVIIAVFELLDSDLGPSHTIYSLVHYTVRSIEKDNNDVHKLNRIQINRHDAFCI